jgi:hypothetical protein
MRVRRVIEYEGKTEAVEEQLGRSMADGLHRKGPITIKVATIPDDAKIYDRMLWVLMDELEWKEAQQELHDYDNSQGR